jgi:hypothetical protein
LDDKFELTVGILNGLGERCRERLMIKSCCFMRGLSATTVLAPPGPRSLAMVVNRWAGSASRSFMAEQGRGDCFQEQDWLSLGIQVIINNSSGTGAHKALLVLDYPGFVGRTPK